MRFDCSLLLITVLFTSALVLPASVAAHYTHGVGEAFVLIRADEEGGPVLQEAGVFLVAEVADGYLGFVDSHELDHLAALGIQVEVLVERDDKSLEYVIEYKVGDAVGDEGIGDQGIGHVPSERHPAARVLFEGATYNVVSVPATLFEAQPNYVVELQRVYRRPLSFVRTPWTEPPLAERGAGPDPLIVSAVAAITQTPLESQVQTLQDFLTRHSRYDGGLNASFWIRDRFLSYGYTDVTLHDYNNWNDNVVCVKPGTIFPDEIVVIGAHYDSINPTDNNDAPGADDNATGTVAVLEAARVLAGVDFERTIVFICFSGEEQGLIGSNAWASEALASGMNLIGMINLDMICYRAGGDAEDLDVITNTASRPLADLAFDAAAIYVPELVTVEGFPTSGSSDHAAFWANGFRAIFLHEDAESRSPYLHTSDDVIGLSANDFPFMLKNVRAATATLAVLARPFHVAIAHQPLGNSAGTGPLAVTADIFAVEPLDGASLELVFRLDGGAFTFVPLAATGNPDEYEAVIPAATAGTHVEYYLTASDVEGFTATSPDDAPAELHDFRTGVEFVFVDDAESDQGWTLGVAGDDATGGVWIRADPVGTTYQPEEDHTADPGTLCFVTGNAAPGDPVSTNDVDDGRTTLLSPLFDLANATWASVSYWRWYADEPITDDVFRVEISNNDGASWQSLEDVVESAFPWSRAVFDDLASMLPLTDQMRVRFIAEDIGGASVVEALVDDFEVVAVRGSTTHITEADVAAVPLARLTVFPSPTGPAGALRFTVPSAGRTEVRIFDARGVLVAKPVDAALGAGAHTVAFDGLNLGSGVYFARLQLDGRVLATHKLTFVK